MSYAVYILRCRDGSYYTGVTNNLEKRVQDHNTAKVGAKYTKARRPVKLIYTEYASDRSAAQTREAAIKQLSRPEKEQLIKRKQSTFTAKVKQFTGKAAWHYLEVPPELIPAKPKTTRWGFIPADIQIGETRWRSSLLPKGKGFYFVAVKAAVRKKESIQLGDTVTTSFRT